MAETVVGLGYALFVLGVVLMFVGKVGAGVKLVVLGVLLIAKTLAMLAGAQFVHQHWTALDTTSRFVWLLIGIPAAALIGVAVGALFVVLVFFRFVRSALAPPEARAALGGAVIGTIAAEVIRGRNDRRAR